MPQPRARSADRERTEPRREGGSASARGATGRSAEIPGIVGRPVDLVVTLEISEADRDVGLAYDDGARCLEPRDDEGILRRSKIPEMRRTPSRRQSSDVEGFLQGHGNAKQRQLFAAPKCCIGGTCRVSGAIEIANDDRVDLTVQRFDARDRMFEQLRRRRLAHAQGA